MTAAELAGWGLVFAGALAVLAACVRSVLGEVDSAPAGVFRLGWACATAWVLAVFALLFLPAVAW